MTITLMLHEHNLNFLFEVKLRIFPYKRKLQVPQSDTQNWLQSETFLHFIIVWLIKANNYMLQLIATTKKNLQFQFPSI